MVMPRTLLEALIQKLRGCNVHGDAEESAVAILWTDPRSEWKPLLPLLRQQLPELFCLGDCCRNRGSSCPNSSAWATTSPSTSRARRSGCAASWIAACLQLLLQQVRSR